MRRAPLLLTVVAIALCSLGAAPAWLHAAADAIKSPWPFFAMDNGVGRGTLSPSQQAEVLKRLGYDGISYNFAAEPELRQRIAAFREAGLPIYGMYFPTRIDKRRSSTPITGKQLALLQGSKTVVWLLAKRAASTGPRMTRRSGLSSRWPTWPPNTGCAWPSIPISRTTSKRSRTPCASSRGRRSQEPRRVDDPVSRVDRRPRGADSRDSPGGRALLVHGHDQRSGPAGP